MNINRLLFRIARSQISTIFIGFAFAYLSRLMPFKKLISNRYIVAFAHPRPIADTHLLIVPKKGIPAFTTFDLAQKENQEIAIAIFAAAQTLLPRSNSVQLETNSILIVNVGAYQDVPQLHFHIIHPVPKPENRHLSGLHQQIEKTESEDSIAFPAPHPTRPFDLVIQTTREVKSWPAIDLKRPEASWALINLLRRAQHEIAMHQLDRYTLIAHTSGAEDAPLRFNLVSGD